jgi:hypothetical protein
MMNDSRGDLNDGNVLSENNLEKDIDSSIVNELDKYEPLRSNKLKSRIDGSMPSYP